MKSRKSTRQDYEAYLNSVGHIPERIARHAAPRKDDKPNYGTWLRRNDPIAFSVGFNDWIRGNTGSL